MKALCVPLLLIALGAANRAGADDPASWMRLWGRPEAKPGRVAIRRDASVFATKPASMLIDLSAEPTTGSIQRGLAVTVGTPLTVSVRMKMGEGMRHARLTVNLIGLAGSHTVAELTGPGDWQAARKAIEVPAGITMAFLHLAFQGQGKLWVDDLTLDGALDTAATGKLNSFGMGFGYAYGSFGKHATVAGGVAHIQAPDGRGGAGFVASADLSSFAAQCPVLHLKTGPKNKANRLRLILDDAGKNKRSFDYDLTQASPDRFTPLLPVDGWAVSPRAADEPDPAFDPAQVAGHQIGGAWTADPVDVFIREIAFAEPTDDLLAKRRAKVEKNRKRLEQERERKRQQAEARERTLKEGADHPEDGPDVQHVGPVAPDILALTIQERRRTPARQIPYVPQEGDEVRTDKRGHKSLVWRDGKPALAPPRILWRKPDGKGAPRKLGILVGGGRTLSLDSQIHGTPATGETLAEPRAYRIASADDPAFAAPVHPQAVFRKSKPLDRASNGQSPVRHVIYLKLPHPLKDGAHYTVALHGVNTRQASVAYAHEPKTTRTDAIHVTQIGYRPTDPLKRAYLSTWLGTGGKLAWRPDRFELLDARTGRSVFAGKVELAIPAERAEMLRPKKNHNKTDVCHLDFSPFAAPGAYRVFVPGLGVSHPFRIADDVWLEAFKTSMHGLLCHRSGIELGPPFTDYRRPRPFHPADGVTIFRLDRTMLDGESDAVRKSLTRMLGAKLDASSLKTHPDAWGGYMDAGDWDRRSQHIRVSYLHLELFGMFPAFFEKAKLALPPAEAANAIPDIVDEALWNLDFYRRLQEPDGGVGGGVESTAHPQAGEASWQESLLVGAFAPDPVSSYRYAASAAKVSGILARYGEKRAAAYRTSAELAWQWAHENGERVIEAVRQRGGKIRGAAAEFLADHRALAAIELYRLTAQTPYHDAFKATWTLTKNNDLGRQLDATFVYASLPDRLGDPALKKRALDALKAQGEQVIQMSGGNAFNIGCRVPQLPMMGYTGYYTTPETIIGPVLPRLHHLTGDAKYLRGAVAATQYGAGANPLNATMTTGVGHDYPRAPLHVDTLRTGATPPRGITIYGPHDPTRAPGWVKTWVLGSSLVPGVDAWPASEFHIDVSAWPEMSEYTVHQSIGPTAYYWGYLAARPATP